MPTNFSVTRVLVFCMLVCAIPAQADVVVSDDLIVQGSQCVGFDCVNGIDFAADTARLRENNLRIRFHDTTAPDVLGQSWNISTNDSANGGLSYFRVELKSVTEDTLRLSDGTAPLYDCTQTDPATGLPLVVGVTPEGEPVIIPISPVGDGSWVCDTVADFTVKPVMSFGTSAESNVTLGFDSKAEAGAVSLGNDSLVRKLRHVAAGVAETDVLIKGDLSGYAAYQNQLSGIADARSRLAELDAQLSEIENKVYNNHAPSAPVLIYPQNNATNIPSAITLKWGESTDADGDPLRYSVTLCENQDFSGCTPEVVASTGFAVAAAGLGGGAGMLLWIGFVLPPRRNARQRGVYAAGLVVAILVMTACNRNDTGGMAYTATTLNPGTQYYWKVTVTDFIDSVDSEVGSFTTE